MDQPRIAFQGELGAFSNEAARRMLGEQIKLIPCRTFDDMFAAVESGKADNCLAPIENSLFGSVYQNYDLLLRSHLKITGEVNLRIVHNLITLPGRKLEDVVRVYSHPVALAQCQKFLLRNPKIEQVSAYDTAGSVKMLVEDLEEGSAAIAGAGAAETYKAEILVSGIEDDPQNYTRFWLLGRDTEAATAREGANKTSIVFTLDNKTGSLFRALAVFALRDIDLTKIESRPLVGRPWEYIFYLDFMGNTEEARVRSALAHLEEFAAGVKVLGCYVSAQPDEGGPTGRGELDIQ